MKVFIANVAANDITARRGLRSRVFDDETFEIVPIPEESGARTPMYSELPAWTGHSATIGDLIPDQLRALRAHADPDFMTCVYGDVLRYDGRPLGRSALLASAAVGDEIWFLARLWDSANKDAQYLVGRFRLMIDPVVVSFDRLKANLGVSDPGILSRILTNPNYLRVQAGVPETAIFLVGDPGRSARFQRAIRVDADVVATIYGADRYDADQDRFFRDGRVLLNKCGTPRRLRTFHSATRAIQPFLESGINDRALGRLTELAAAAGRASAPGFTQVG